MVKKFARFIISYTTILILEKCAVVQNKHTCVITEKDNYKTADCTNQNFITTVPQDLDKDIKKLDLSGAKIKELDSASFKSYSNLVVLKCENIKITTNIVDKYLFESLTNLEELYLKNFVLTEASAFQWPASIKILNITQCMVQNLNLASIVQLRVLDASANELQDIPTFSELAPMQYVNLKDNPLGAATVTSLARSCRVNNLDMALTGNSDLKTQKLYCTCKAILDWISKFQIKTNVQTEEGTFQCNSYAAKDAKCEKEFPAATLKIRDDCLAKSIPSKSYFLIFVIIVIVTAVVLIALLLFAYLYGSLQKKKEIGDVEEIHHGKDSPSSASEENIEEEPPFSPSDEPHLV